MNLPYINSYRPLTKSEKQNLLDIILSNVKHQNIVRPTDRGSQKIKRAHGFYKKRTGR